MPIIGLSKLEEEWIYHDSDENTHPDQRTEFLVGAVDVDARNHLMDRTNVQEMMPDGAYRIVTRGMETNTQWCRLGLRGWRKFHDENGVELPFRTTSRVWLNKNYVLVDDSSMSALPPHIITWLGQEIFERNALSVELRKKLKPVLSQLNSLGTTSVESAVTAELTSNAAA